jgi:hypothetical protein
MAVGTADFQRRTSSLLTDWAVLDELDHGMHQRWFHLSSHTHFRITRFSKFRAVLAIVSQPQPRRVLAITG